jgi:hypothetical protein
MAEGGTPRRLSFVFRFALPPTPQQHQPKQRKEHHPKQASTDQRGTRGRTDLTEGNPNLYSLEAFVRRIHCLPLVR